MEKLLESYAGDVEAIEAIIEARKALVDFYVTTLRYSMIVGDKEKESEISLDAYDAAKDAVITLNAMCRKKGIEPVYTGGFEKAHSLFCFAEELTASIFVKAMANK